MEDRGYERVAHLYDLFDSKDNLDFFAHYAARAGEVLDVGAGTGRIALPLAAQGIPVTCVEPSPAMRAQFRAKLQAQPELAARVTLVAADAATFDLGRTFPLALLSGTYDHFLSPAARRAALGNVARHLALGGTLLLDVFIGLMGDAPLTPAGKVTAGDKEYRRFIRRQVLPEGQVALTLVYEVYQDGELQARIEQPSRAGITDRAAVQRALDETGFVVAREFCDYAFTPYREGAELLVVEGRREDK